MWSPLIATMHKLIAFWGTAWTFEVDTFSELRELLGSAPGLAGDVATIVVLSAAGADSYQPAPEQCGARICARLRTSLTCTVCIALCFANGGWRACCSPVGTGATLLCCRDYGYAMYLVDKTGGAPVVADMRRS